MNQSITYTTNLAGVSGRTPFDDTPSSVDFQTSSISKIAIQHSGYIHALEVYYSWNNGQGITHGHLLGQREELAFDTGEIIITIIGCADSGSIVGLTFVTNKRTWGPFGGTTGQPFKWSGPPSPGLDTLYRIRVVAFSGYADQDLAGMRAIFYCGPDPPILKTIRYESPSELALSEKASVPTGVSKNFSNFTFHLMNPIVALNVGEERVKFNAHQDTLCQLPFFKAALLGSFKEASDQAIDMPEDDPGHVSALIEFLYTKNYTYRYNSENAQLMGSGSTPPKGDLVEGLFHVGIFVTASKYDCPGLVELATAHFEVVVSELDGINALRLWKTAYSDGLQFPGRLKEFDQYRSREGLVAWVKELFRDHREEMDQTISEFPMLSADLLRITTGNDY